MVQKFMTVSNRPLSNLLSPQVTQRSCPLCPGCKMAHHGRHMAQDFGSDSCNTNHLERPTFWSISRHVSSGTSLPMTTLPPVGGGFDGLLAKPVQSTSFEHGHHSPWECIDKDSVAHETHEIVARFKSRCIAAFAHTIICQEETHMTTHSRTFDVHKPITPLFIVGFPNPLCRGFTAFGGTLPALFRWSASTPLRAINVNLLHCCWHAAQGAHA